MTIFNEIKLSWEGREYVIPSDNVMKIIAKVEDVITLSDLSKCATNKTLPLAKLSQAYALILQHAGVQGVDEEKVYAGMFSANLQENAQRAVTTLLMLMIPPSHLQRLAEEGASQGKVVAVGVRSSRKRTK